MYAPPPVAVSAAPRTGGLAAAPILAICCLLLILFAIAATIVLALIPIYLPKKNVSTNEFSAPNYLYSNYDGKLPIGPVTNTDQIARALEIRFGIPTNSISVNSAAIGIPVGKRKRRKFDLRRNRRQVGLVLIIIFVFIIALCPPCITALFTKKFESFDLALTLLSFDGIEEVLTLLLLFTKILTNVPSTIAPSTSTTIAIATTTLASVTSAVG